MFRLEEEVTRWRTTLAHSGVAEGEDAEELESHLWDLIEADLYTGMPPQEAFTRASERMGEPQRIAEEFEIFYLEVSMDLENSIIESRENPEELERLYHQKPQAFSSCLSRALEKHPDARVLMTWRARLSYTPFRAEKGKELVELIILVALCAAAALAVKLPALWGIDVWKIDEGANSFYPRNFSFFFLPMIAFYYIFKERPRAWMMGVIAGIFLASLAAANFMPGREPFHTRVLSILHLPLLLWLVVGLAFTGADWRKPEARLDFLRATGEIFIYAVLILLGGGVLTGFTLVIFNLIGIDIQRFYLSWVAAIGLFAAPIVATYLAEKKRELVENFAPILSYIFTPLFLVTLVVFLFTMIALGKSPYTDRDFLLIFNGMLLLVIALTLFNITERKMNQAARIFDAMNAVLIVAALAVDGIALSAIIVRLSAYGVSANKIAVLGENLLLLANLLGLGWQYLMFFAGRARFSKVENWTALFLPAYFGWLAVVVFFFPVLFRFS
jgi:hypothetical protein